MAFTWLWLHRACAIYQSVIDVKFPRSQLVNSKDRRCCCWERSSNFIGNYQKLFPIEMKSMLFLSKIVDGTCFWVDLSYSTNIALFCPTCMMTSSNEAFSALLAFCKRNQPITGAFLSQRPVTRSFDVFFDVRLNKRLNKQSRYR